MRVSGFLPLFNCRKRDYKAEDDKYQAISTFFLTFLLIFYAELFLLTEVISTTLQLFKKKNIVQDTLVYN
ncbi:hypothetical protein ADH76_15485 [Enterocloster clostridioformis]|nr:hypothetical protein A4V08_35910 [Lachnoclostridium sp. YL32]OXE67437.1 hypothetical protein ADH76_15485 [Enterocloster clostridioformis]